MTSLDKDVSVLEALDQPDLTGEAFPVCDSVRSVDSLIAGLTDARSRAFFSASIKSIQRQDTQTLIARIQSTENPLTLWVIHLELDKREIPPRLRWPASENSPQSEFITWLADVYWLAKRFPGQKVEFKNWQCAFTHEPATLKWHKALHAKYLFATRRLRSAHYFAYGFGLLDDQRQSLMCFQTNAMRAATKRLKNLAEDRERLLTHAMQNPDKAGQYSPSTIANRRATLWKLYLLTGKNQTNTVRYYREITGGSITRQALAKQLHAIEAALS